MKSTLDHRHANLPSKTGFTLSEMMLTTVIVGILSSIALPNYVNQVNRTRQNEAASTISQIQTTIASYADEFRVLPNSWAELNDTSAVMTDKTQGTKATHKHLSQAINSTHQTKNHSDEFQIFT